MAVEDKYVNSSIVAGKKGSSYVGGAKEVTLITTVEVAAADDDGSKYRLFKAVPSNMIPTEITIATDGLTGGTDYDLGVYAVNLGAVIDKDMLMDGQTMASALTRATGHQLGLGIVDIANVGSSLADLDAVSTDKPAAYDIVLTANTVGSAAGTITVIAKFISK